MLEKSKDARDRISYLNILNLMTTYEPVVSLQQRDSSNNNVTPFHLTFKFYRYPALRVAYIDEVEHPSSSGTQTSYYSVLVKGVGHKSHEVLPEPKHNVTRLVALLYGYI